MMQTASFFTPIRAVRVPTGSGSCECVFERFGIQEIKDISNYEPIAEDGKSTITLNLATALAEGGKRSVLMVASAYALTDELHQVFSRGRPASLIDYINTPGSAIAIFLVYGARGSLLRSSSTGTVGSVGRPYSNQNPATCAGGKHSLC